ncbi:unnamed protein product [Caenorhabditis sp. 36 PRJEB53466]|nr:unnamed protein product [Caenorhabditis sp. 36 PRJEB53466]
MSDVHRVWEDATAEKSLVLTRDYNPQYAYVANYPWLFFADNKKLHIVAYFEENLEVECHVRVKFWFTNQESQFFERQEPFPLGHEEGDTYEMESTDWESVEIFFRVTQLYGSPYLSPLEQTDWGVVVTVGDKRVFVNLETICRESEVLKELRNYPQSSVITIFDVDPDVFLEMLRVVNPPYKRISRANFVDLLLLACRFRMTPLFNRLEQFTKTEEYNKKWMTKWVLKKIERILQEEPGSNIEVLDEFRATKRLEKPLKQVRIRDPEVEIIHEDVVVRETSCLGAFADYCSEQKSRIIYLLLTVLLIENLLLLTWFICIYRNK